jgi:hypothetical protein
MTSPREPYQYERVLALFNAHQGVLHTGDFLDDIHLRNEWRARLTELRRKGYKIESFKASPKVWCYRLIEPVRFEFDQKGQGVFTSLRS